MSRIILYYKTYTPYNAALQILPLLYIYTLAGAYDFGTIDLVAWYYYIDVQNNVVTFNFYEHKVKYDVWKFQNHILCLNIRNIYLYF